MNSDLFIYLSGRIPGGLYLLIGAILLFTIVWLSVWFGTRYFNLRRLYLNLLIGIGALSAVYSVAWLVRPPNPIPKRVMFVHHSNEPNTSVSFSAVNHLLELRLRQSPLKFTIITEEIFFYQKDDNIENSFADWYKWNRLRWLVFTKYSQGVIDLKVYTGNKDGINIQKQFTLPIDTDFKTLFNAVEQTIQLLDNGKSTSEHTYFPSYISDDERLSFFKGLHHLKQYELAEGSALLNELSAKYPAWQNARMELVKFWLSDSPNRWYDSLRINIDEVIFNDKHNTDALLALGIWAVHFRQWDRAESALRLYQNRFPQDPRGYYYLSHLSDNRLQDFQWHEQSKLLRHAIHLAPCYEKGRIALAKWLMSIQKHFDAEKFLREGLNHNSTSLELLRTMVVLKLETYNPQEAIDYLTIIFTSHEGGSIDYYNMGISQFALEQFEDAIINFNKSLALGGTVENHFYIGAAYQRLEDWDASLLAFQRRASLLQSNNDFYARKARERVQQILAIKEMLQAEQIDTFSQDQNK